MLIATIIGCTLLIIELDKRTQFRYKGLPILAFMGVCSLVGILVS